MLGAVVGVTSHGAPTGLGAADVTWRLVVGVATSVLAIWAGPFATAAAGAVGALFGGLPGGAVGAAVALAAVALAWRRHPRRGHRWRRLWPSSWPGAGAVLGAVVAAVALHLPTAGHSPRVAVPAGAMVAVIWLGGLLQLPRRARRRAWRGVAAGALLALGATTLAGLAVLRARPAVNAGLASADQATASVRRADGRAAQASFAAAGQSFARARHALDAWWVLPARALPGVGPQVAAARSAAISGSGLAGAGAGLSAQLRLDLRIQGGQLPLDRISALDLPLRQTQQALHDASARLGAARSPWLVGPLDRRLGSAIAQVRRAQADSDRALRTERLVPGLLGAAGPRRYLVLIQTPSEARGSGGFAGDYAEITADQGRLAFVRLGHIAELNVRGAPPAQRHIDAPADWLARYSRFQPASTWQSINLSPDFPATAQAAASLYPQSGGERVDGVIGIDPEGLAGLLEVAGPVAVTGWPVPLSGSNTNQILLYDEYVRYPDTARYDFLGDAARAIFDHLTNSSLPTPGALAASLSPVVTGRHLQLYSVRPQEQSTLSDLGLAGAAPPVRGDALGVVVQNSTGNKIDWFLRQAVDYQVSLDPGNGTLRAKAKIELRNTAPANGLPLEIIGSSLQPPLPTGTSRLYVSVYTPWGLAGATLNGRPTGLQSELELGRRVYSAYIDIPPGGTATLTLDLQGSLRGAATYRLDVMHQPTVTPPQVTASLSLATGWKAVPIPPTSGSLALSRPGVLDRDRVAQVALQFGSRPGTAAGGP